MRRLVFVFVLLVVVCGCRYAIIHKRDIHEFHQCFQTYRAHVEPIDEPGKVDKLGDRLERILTLWKEGYNAEEP